MNIFSGGRLQEYSATKVSLSSQPLLASCYSAQIFPPQYQQNRNVLLLPFSIFWLRAVPTIGLKPQSIHPGDQRLHSGMQRQVISPRQHVDQLQVEVRMLWQLIEQQILQQQWTGSQQI